jgi:hypothetical protein
MPFSTELTKDCLGIVHAGSGVVTGEELVVASTAAAQLVQNTENFQYEVSDFTDATELRIEPHHIEKIAAIDRVAAVFRPRAIIVIIAPQNSAYEMACAWHGLVSDLGWAIHIARDRAAGIGWLGQHLKTERPELLAEKKQDAA